MMMLYRFLLAVAMLAALVTFWADWRDKKFSFLPKYALGAGLLILATGFALLEHFEAKKRGGADYSAAKSSQGGQKNINISASDVKGLPWPATQTDKSLKLEQEARAPSGGDFSARDGAQGGMGNLNIKDSRIEIHQGDPPEVRERKIETAKQVAADGILTSLSAIDARLSYVQTALRDDPFETELKAINDKLAPSAAQQLTGGYRQLIGKYLSGYPILAVVRKGCIIS
jgi:hypothetical protein